MMKLNKITLSLLVIGVLLIVYGYVAIITSLYVFWESKSIGWIVLFLGLFGVLNHVVKKRKEQKRKSVVHVIGMVVICFVLLVKTILGVVILSSDAYVVAKEFAKNEKAITAEVGEITGFGFAPVGAMGSSTANGVSVGNATIHLLVKGKESYQIYKVLLYKDNNNPWEVYEYQ